MLYDVLAPKKKLKLFSVKKKKKSVFFFFWVWVECLSTLEFVPWPIHEKPVFNAELGFVGNTSRCVNILSSVLM